MADEEVEVVFLMADLSGYTALTEVHGNIQAAGAVTRYAEIAHAPLQPGARLVERVGDGARVRSRRWSAQQRGGGG